VESGRLVASCTGAGRGVGTCGGGAASVGHGGRGGRCAGLGRPAVGTRRRGRRPLVSLRRLEPAGGLPAPDGGHLSRAYAGSGAASLVESGGPRRVREGRVEGRASMAGASHPRELAGVSTPVAVRSLSVTVAAAAVATGAVCCRFGTLARPLAPAASDGCTGRRCGLTRP